MNNCGSIGIAYKKTGQKFMLLKYLYKFLFSVYVIYSGYQFANVVLKQLAQLNVKIEILLLVANCNHLD